MAGARPGRRRPARAHEAQGEADARAARSAPGGEGRAQGGGGGARGRGGRAGRARAAHPEPAARRRARRLDRGRRRGAAARRRATDAPPTRTTTSSSVDSTWSARRACPARASATGSGTRRRLALALYRLALDRLAAAGFVTVLPPVLVREGALIGTGAFPSDEANVYELPPTTSTSPGRPRSRSRASTPARSSRATSFRSATSRSRRASAARRAPRAATRAG